MTLKITYSRDATSTSLTSVQHTAAVGEPHL